MLQPDGAGSGTHAHWSLLDRAGRPTHGPARPCDLSAAAERMAAGMLHHMPALVAVSAPSVASFHRLRPGRRAPTMADLGVQGRGSAVRVCPVHATAPETAVPETAARQLNVEFRVADAAAGPCLALGALARAGLDGLAPAPLPASLAEAAGHFEASAAAADWLGPLHDLHLRFKRAEKALAGLDEAAVCARYAAIP